jgi:5S rRNA maturation endonuclease (ribonuclease M5)
MKLDRKVQVITKSYIFAKISEYDVYRYYIGDFTIGQSRKSPFHKDNNPSFSVYMRDGKIQHRDHSDDQYRGDCINLVEQLYNLDIKDALKKIAKDFGIEEGKDESARITSQYVKPFMDQKRHSYIQVSVRKWNQDDANYWKQFGITSAQLKEDNVYPLKELFINKQRYGLSKDEIAYVYRYDEGYKIYFPNRPKEDRWKSNIPLTIVENRKVIQGADRVFIVKSKKDRLCLNSIFPDERIINVQNESVAAYTNELLQELKGKEVWISYDSDPAGKKASIKITKEFGFKHINVPDKYWEEDSIKDWADLYKNYGSIPVIKHFTDKVFLEKIV